MRLPHKVDGEITFGAFPASIYHVDSYSQWHWSFRETTSLPINGLNFDLYIAALGLPKSNKTADRIAVHGGQIIKTFRGYQGTICNL